MYFLNSTQFPPCLWQEFLIGMMLPFKWQRCWSDFAVLYHGTATTVGRLSLYSLRVTNKIPIRSHTYKSLKLKHPRSENTLLAVLKNTLRNSVPLNFSRILSRLMCLTFFFWDLFFGDLLFEPSRTWFQLLWLYKLLVGRFTT